MATSQHIIRQQIVDLELTQLSQASAIQEKINRLCNRQLQPALERLLEQYADGDTVIRLEKVEVDLGEIELSKLDTLFTEKVVSQLTRELSAITKPVSPSGRQDGLLSTEPLHLSSRDTVLHLFIYFLKKGHFPWWAKDRSLAVLEKELKEVLSTDVREILLTVLSRNARALRRLIIQFTDDLLISIAGLVEREQEARALLQWLQWAGARIEGLDRHELRVSYWAYATTTYAGSKSGPRLSFEFVWEAMHAIARDQSISTPEFFSMLAAARSAGKQSPHDRQWDDDHSSIVLSAALAEVVENVLNRALPGPYSDAGQPSEHFAHSVSLSKDDHVVSDVDMRSDDPKMPQGYAEARSRWKNSKDGYPLKNKIEEGDTEIYITNAGIVLLHPFLLPLLRELDLVEKNDFKDERSRHKAVSVLAYAGSGDPETPEHHLCLHKLLCGIPVEEPLRRTDALSGTETEKIEELLVAVIGHWQALKNTTPDGLRQTFLQREGKLLQTEQGWHLHVAQKGYDILMGNLPWGISMIKLPWMTGMLQVDWT